MPKTKRKKDNNNPLNFNTDWQYAAAPENTDHIELKQRYDLFINGKFTPPSKGKYFKTINPSSEQKIADVAEATKEDVFGVKKGVIALSDTMHLEHVTIEIEYESEDCRQRSESD